jgi:poly(beta-D-mannuronate) lyase
MIAMTILISGCKSSTHKGNEDASNKADYVSRCSKEPPSPYTGPLSVESKYDQSDVTKSRLKASTSSESREIQEVIQAYTKQLVTFLTYYESKNNSKDQARALACFDVWLQTWSEGGALLTEDATKTGRAVRKWTLAAIASSIIKAQALTQGQYAPNKVQQDWLDALAQHIISDYSPRLEPGFPYFNNHDYWAGWAVAATGKVIGKSSYQEWGHNILRKGLAQIVLTSDGQYGYLPNEVAREQLAANYIHYALVPLALLYDSSQRQGFPITTEEKTKLLALGNFAAELVLRPERLKAIVKGEQEDVAPYKMVWLIPFLVHFPDQTAARSLYKTHEGDIDNYSQIGGSIRVLYPDFKEQ